MDADLAWCPNCERAIVPIRQTVTVTVPVTKGSQPPPPPPSSPRSRKAAANQRKGGLVNGTGRVRPNGSIRAPSPTHSLPATREKTRVILDHTPLLDVYCSDECRVADMHLRRRTAPFNPQSDDPQEAPKKVKAKARRGEVAGAPSDPEDEAAGDSDSSVEQLPILWEWQKPPPPPPPPSVNKLLAFMPSVNIDSIPAPKETTPTPATIPPPVYNGGLLMTGRLLGQIAPEPIKSRIYRWDPAPERHAPIKGWNDGSDTWREAIYGNGRPQGLDTDPYGRAAKEHQRVTGGVRPVPIRPDPVGKFSTGSLPSDAAMQRQLEDPHNLRATSAQMLGRVNDAFAQRANSRINMYTPASHRSSSAASVASSDAGSTTSRSPPSPTIMRRERSLLSPGAEGRLLVPNVKLTVRSASASCISSGSTDPIPISRRSSSNGSSAGRSSRTRRSTTARSPLSHEHGGWLGPHLSSSLEDEAAEKEQNRTDDEEEIEVDEHGRETKESADRRRQRRESRRHMEVFEREERERERLFGGALTNFRPVHTTRSLSYDDVQVYDAMPMPEGKPLFRFAPKTVRIA